MIHSLYGVRVSAKEFALANVYVHTPHILTPPQMDKARWILCFCRNFRREAA